MKTLNEIFIEESCDKSTLYHGYAPFYAGYMDAHRDAPITLLEMGIQFGQSMKSWMRYFANPSASFIGMDIAQEFKSNDPRYFFFLCDQANADSCGFPPASFDFIIDDAGHYATAQFSAFNALWATLNPGGCYFIEDIFTLFHDHWKSTLRTGDLLYELFSMLNKGGKQFHGRPGGNMDDCVLNYFEKTVQSIESHPGIIILKKRA